MCPDERTNAADGQPENIGLMFSPTLSDGRRQKYRGILCDLV